ncbi:MAG: hypothetical protein WCO55_01670 [Candidatus Falkowbacteria bacterium]
MICEIITGFIDKDEELAALKQKVNNFRKSLEGDNQPDEITTIWLQSSNSAFFKLTAIVEYARAPKGKTNDIVTEIAAKFDKL